MHALILTALLGKTWLTYPMPPRPKPADPLRVNPGYQVPEHPEHYVWKVSGKLNGKMVFAQGVPLVNFEGGAGSRMGVLAVGTEVKLDVFRKVGRALFYEVPVDGKKLYVSGLYLEPTSYTPPPP